jgi:hypothetical protein
MITAGPGKGYDETDPIFGWQTWAKKARRLYFLQLSISNIRLRHRQQGEK